MLRDLYELDAGGRLFIMFCLVLFISICCGITGQPMGLAILLFCTTISICLHPELVGCVGLLLLACGRVDSALALSEYGLGLRSNCKELSRCKVLSLIALQRYSEAESELTRWLEYAPKDTSARALRSGAQRCLYKYKEAENDACRIIEEYPSLAIGYLHRIDSRMAQQDYEGAVADCLQVQKFGGNSSVVRIVLVYSYLMSGRFEDAERLVASFAERVKPASTEALCIAYCHYYRNEFTEILEICSHVVETHQFAPSFFLIQFLAYWRLNEGREALSTYSSLRAVSPPDASVCSLKAYILAEVGRTDDALAECLAVPEPFASRSFALEGKSYVLWRRHEWQQMFDASQSAVVACPASAFAHAMRGIALTGLERFDEAIDSALNAIRIQKLDPWGWYSLANAQLKTGRVSEAVNSLSAGIAADPHHRVSYQLRAEAYRLFGDSENASSDQARYDELQAKLLAGVEESSQHT